MLIVLSGFVCLFVCAAWCFEPGYLDIECVFIYIEKFALQRHDKIQPCRITHTVNQGSW